MLHIAFLAWSSGQDAHNSSTRGGGGEPKQALVKPHAMLMLISSEPGSTFVSLVYMRH